MFTLRNNRGPGASCPLADRDGRDAVAGQNISARLGTRWEPPALVTAPGGFVPLTCAPLHLQKHSGVLAAEKRVHAWGSRGRRFKSGRPDWFFEHLLPESGTKPAMIVPTWPRRPGHTTHRGDHAAGDRVAAIAATRRPAPSRTPILASQQTDSSGPGPGVQHRPQAGRRDQPTPDRPGAPRASCPRSPPTRPPPRPASPATAPRRPPRCTTADPPARRRHPGTPATSDDSSSTGGGHTTRHHPPSPRQANHAQPRRTRRPAGTLPGRREPQHRQPSPAGTPHRPQAHSRQPDAGNRRPLPVTAAHDHDNLHHLADRLSPPQAERLRVPAAPRSRVCPRRAARSSRKAGRGSGTCLSSGSASLAAATCQNSTTRSSADP